ncbi:uncharacterized protein LOC103496828 isoform X1 [Cucumis melo]|uniref:Uncharacterized protein LOC103496828 isoform X1 n=1 Tax=Cucumis melo TaxID=3656 RepID=A0ABM3KUL8_CUCME|nr:uncharacterized protein LOC103496828 isoform X1 [Cucumis melo]
MKKDSSPLMKKDNSMNPNLKLLLPPPDEVSFAFITRSGTFTDGDLLVNKDDVQIVSQTDDESEICGRNQKNRSKLNVYHTCGSQSIQQRVEKEVQDIDKPSRIRIWVITHLSNKGLPVNEDTQEKLISTK